jgi:NADH:ubiquinone oxidoreductase subunit F (NADH-binding)
MTFGTTVPHPGQPGQPLTQPGGSAGAGLPRLLPAQGAVPVDLRTHLDRLGWTPYTGQAGRLIPVLQAAGLTGRGGAAFPVYRKLAAVAKARTQPVVIGNGAESEPASEKDKSLLWISPHLVLDGLQLAAEAVGSDAVGLYLNRHPRLLENLHAAIAERAAAGVDRAGVEIFEAPHRFLAGEESALASRVNGGPAMPRFKPPMVFERGVAGRPTLVHNVETLAHLALIARFGPDWFRAAGTDDEPGSMLCTLHQADGRRDVVETELGTPLHSLLTLDGHTQAVLSGGYHGAWLPAADAVRMTLSNADLRPAGAFVGAGVLAALPADRCGIAEAARVARYLALESAGQCGPCFNGLPRIAAAMAEIASPRPDPRAVTDMIRWAGLVQGRGACHHPDGTVRFIRSALHVFRDEITRHGQGRCVDPARRPFLPLPAGTALSAADWS